ncbi:cytosine/uracil/thiamine/allantoin permease [Pullulanibacillus camelliae]|uniref:Cytosine/uracil/thiamine/allantoin permease n=1 Tax=Pullulanibacillus camelliae TaxID=1707096 RepID=A0A8J2YE47_9BACL|nr:cytosine permease [Pullulanibacillus camelliae]GGE35849.1 cytosine/uracil/thiamine/allantoin permease [Pullulanibacillus camelliae]
MNTNESILPIPKKNRYASSLSIFWLWSGGNVLLTNFVSGSSYAQGIGLFPMLVMTLCANFFGLALCAWDTQRSGKYGIDEMVSIRPTFGYNGSIFGVLVLVIINFGWVGILASMAGSACKIIVQGFANDFSFPGDFSLYALGAGIVFPLVILMFSQKAAFILSRITVPILLLFALYILIVLLKGDHWRQMVQFKPDHSTNWTMAFEIIVAFAISWFPYLGSWNRFAKTQRKSFWATFFGLGSSGILFAAIGGMATLATGKVDPAQWSDQLHLGVIALFIIILGTATSVTHLLGAGTMGILSVFPKWNYRYVSLAVTLPSVIFVYMDSLQQMFNTLLIFVGLLAGPYWGIIMIDYFFLRKQQIDVKACYDPEGIYKYFHGWNPIAVGCQIVGIIFWLYLGGWQSNIKILTFSSGHYLFNYISATLPSMLLSGLLYFIVGKWAFSKLPLIGGYHFQKRKVKKTLSTQKVQ